MFQFILAVVSFSLLVSSDAAKVQPKPYKKVPKPHASPKPTSSPPSSPPERYPDIWTALHKLGLQSTISLANLAANPPEQASDHAWWPMALASNTTNVTILAPTDVVSTVSLLQAWNAQGYGDNIITFQAWTCPISAWKTLTNPIPVTSRRSLPDSRPCRALDSAFRT